MKFFGLHFIAAFVFGFVTAVLFLIPVLLLLGSGLVIVLIFTVFWYAFLTWVGNRYGFYDRGLIPFSIGSSLGIVLSLYYQTQINAYFGV